MILLVVSLLFALIILGFPIAISLLLVSLVYFTLNGIPMSVVTQQMLNGASSFILVAVPLYIFAGQLMNLGGITNRIVNFCNALLGRIRGGLAQVNIFASMIFSGISGEAVADTAGLGSVMVPSMKKLGYPKEFSAAVTAGSAVAGPIIPPSIPMVICASLAGVSVGKMFLGGAVPGILFIISAMVFTYILSVKNKFPVADKTSKSVLLKSFKDAFWALLAPVIIVGSLVMGVVTPTEAGVIAVVYVFFIGFFVYKELRIKDIFEHAWQTIVTTGAIMFILSLANVYTYLLTREQVAEVLANSLFSLTQNTIFLYLIVLFVALIVGAFLSTTAGLLLLIPILGPIVSQTGMDPIHFYVLVTIALCVGTLTPPVGINLYLSAQIAEASPEKVFYQMIPYILILFLIILIAIFIPEIVLWLPNKMIS
ncbi:TRAP transporter large permease [Alteribacillus sp. YIM 98480]|uniref:TRAP transporter large permease n=1 Tax=Alteribacillus sp. YIM 98480 TaxID=2606599 RepID=UPI00131C029C|nr:TRAP transporter large permease [Alteribacillus sp. YIM 98480]